jgi:serine/threonine protein phosphatase PrpC
MKKPDIQERCIKNPNAGCTALIALIIKGVLYIANVGDSRAILCNKSVAYDLSKDHKPDDPKEKARIESLGGMINAGRVNGSLNLSRALGDFEFKNIERNS